MTKEKGFPPAGTEQKCYYVNSFHFGTEEASHSPTPSNFCYIIVLLTDEWASPTKQICLSTF